MFEVFLFINPIGIYCYDTENLIKKTIDDLNVDVCFHYIPLVNSEVIKSDIIRRTKDGQNISNISKYTIAAYQSLKYYHAIKLNYGNKKARSFLFQLQKAINRNFAVYTPALPIKIAKELKLDSKSITSYQDTNYIFDSINEDKMLAKKYDIKHIPTTIIFNESDTYNGILLEGRVAYNNLLQLFKNENGCRFGKLNPSPGLRLI
ncbi:DsbA family protein [Lactobacillus sp. ESL0791]|uniref:DsbA family protein n=1 Tax=Lactobacillus sp. ESL0791 TaxID=2983234 RepID=UPI0023F8DFDB|nr:DsbA family protein [Lactobacillus sp. ESL0791]MDF7638548.1 DsbA family protein [Lactobacillus sp. ESL0791]